ncbi:MAG: TRAP transporter substrate-binding protein DctP [Desulfatibacillaceae bacterium]
MRKKYFVVAAVLAVMAACLVSSPTPAEAEDVVLWKIASLAPKGMGWANQVNNMVVPWFEETTNDVLRLKVYFGGIMGTDEDYLEKMRIGQLQGAGLTGRGANLACPEFSVVGLPFLFKNYKEVDYIKDKMFTTFEYFFEQNGYKLVLWIDQDFDQIYSTKWRFDNLADFRKAKFQTWYGPQEEAMLKALGADPIPMDPTKVPTAMREGTIDSNIGPALFQVGSQMFAVSRYVNTIKIRYAPAIIIVTMDAWNQLPRQYQRKLWEKRADVQEMFSEATRRDNEKSLEAMIGYGVQPVELTEENRQEIRERAMTVYDDLSGELYPRELLMELGRFLADYRGVPVSEITGVAVAGREPAKPAVPPSTPTPEPEPRSEPEPVEVAEPEASQPEPEQIAPEPKPEPRKLTSWEKRVKQIKDVQRVLRSLGYYKLAIDGIPGPGTYNGILMYQRANGLPATGAINQDLLEHMGLE